jgi:hypothetical protein
LKSKGKGSLLGIVFFGARDCIKPMPSSAAPMIGMARYPLKLAG